MCEKKDPRRQIALMREALGGLRWKTVADDEASNRLVFV